MAMKKKPRNRHIGSTFDSFLDEQGLLADVNSAATKRVLQLLAEHGDALTVVREVDHFAYFPSAELRADFIAKCLASGFKLRGTIEPYRPGSGFGAILP